MEQQLAIILNVSAINYMCTFKRLSMVYINNNWDFGTEQFMGNLDYTVLFSEQH